MHAVRVFTRRHLGQIILEVRKLLPSFQQTFLLSYIKSQSGYRGVVTWLVPGHNRHFLKTRCDDGGENYRWQVYFQKKLWCWVSEAIKFISIYQISG